MPERALRIFVNEPLLTVENSFIYINQFFDVAGFQNINNVTFSVAEEMRSSGVTITLYGEPVDARDTFNIEDFGNIRIEGGTERDWLVFTASENGNSVRTTVEVAPIDYSNNQDEADDESSSAGTGLEDDETSAGGGANEPHGDEPERELQIHLNTPTFTPNDNDVYLHEILDMSGVNDMDALTFFITEEMRSSGVTITFQGEPVSGQDAFDFDDFINIKIEGGAETDWVTFTATESVASTIGGQTAQVTIEIAPTDYSGDDILIGEENDDLIRGLNGDDEIYGNDGNDTLAGNAGNDHLYGDRGDDTLYGGQDNDVLRGGEGNDFVVGGVGNDALAGNAGNDRLHGGAGEDRLFGGSGDDFIRGGYQDDLLHGGSGNDDLAANQGNDLLYGDAGNDIVFGGDDDDVLFGGTGNDSLKGGRGDDILVGGEGDDTLRGGTGADTFVFNDSEALSIDTILDFDHELDSLLFNITDDIGATREQVGNDVHFGFNDTTIVLADTNLSDLVHGANYSFEWIG